MHSVLNFQHVVLHSALKESLEHTATVSSLITILREHSGWQLLLITDEDDFLRLMLEGYEVCQLN